MKFQLDSTENTWKQVPRKDIALLLEFQQRSTAGLEGLNCKFKYVNAPPLKIIKSGVGKVILKRLGPLMLLSPNIS